MSCFKVDASFAHNDAHVSIRKATADDFEFAFKVKCDAMRKTIELRWGWDEAFQLAHHSRRWSERAWFIVERNTVPIGTVALDFFPTHLQLGEFYLRCGYRNQGIGDRLLKEILRYADSLRLEARLEVLHWNPAQRLYYRHGFLQQSANEIHYFLVRLPRVDEP